MLRATVLFFGWMALIFCYSVGESQVQVITLENKIEKGEVLRLETKPVAQVVLKTPAAAAKKIRCEDIVEIIFSSSKQVKPASTTVILNDGSLLYGTIIDGNQKHIYFESLSFGRVRIDLTKIREIRLVTGLPALNKRETENDVLYFKAAT